MGYRKHYAILLDNKGNIISEKSNNDGDCNHAEMRTLKNVDRKKCLGGTIIVVRQVMQNLNGNYEVCGSMSRPCKLCMKHIIRSKVSNIIYSTGDPNMPWEKIRSFK